MTKLSVKTAINSDIKTVWRYFTHEAHIPFWHFASEDWYVQSVVQDFTTNGAFNYRLSSKDHRYQFEFKGHFMTIVEEQLLVMKLEDDRMVEVLFQKGKTTTLQIRFDPEPVMTHQQQKDGWQQILNHFKDYTEASFKSFEVIEDIKGSEHQLWFAMTNSKVYGEWSSPYASFDGKWLEGGEVILKHPEQHATKVLVAEARPGRKLKLVHLGLMDADGKLDAVSEKALEWKGMEEIYQFNPQQGHTFMKIKVDCHEAHVEQLRDKWIAGLKNLKEIVEEV